MGNIAHLRDILLGKTLPRDAFCQVCLTMASVVLEKIFFFMLSMYLNYLTIIAPSSKVINVQSCNNSAMVTSHEYDKIFKMNENITQNNIKRIIMLLFNELHIFKKTTEDTFKRTSISYSFSRGCLQ